MWIAKVKIKGQEALIGSRTAKYKVSCTGYPISIHETRNYIQIYISGFIFGEEGNVKKFLRDLTKDKRVIQIEKQKNFYIAKIKEPLKLKEMYNPKIFHVEPILINENGDEFWTIGSFNKKELNKFMRLIEKRYQGKILKLTKKRISSLSLISIYPNLTDKQRKALELAIRNGYYEYPRKIKLEKLAKIMNVSFSTFQAHLRKAEQKLVPFLFEKA